jgi:hypothetical protein
MRVEAVVVVAVRRELVEAGVPRVLELGAPDVIDLDAGLGAPFPRAPCPPRRSAPRRSRSTTFRAVPRAYGGLVVIEWPDRDSREWLLGPRGGELGVWAEAVEHLPGVDSGIAALLCVAQSPPTVWMRDEVVEDLAVWDVLKSLVMAYDAGDRDEATWAPVLGGEAHLAVLSPG